MKNIESMTNEQLEAQLLAERRLALKSWPYTGTNSMVRTIEGEFRIRNILLPEERPENRL